MVSPSTRPLFAECILEPQKSILFLDNFSGAVQNVVLRYGRGKSRISIEALVPTDSEVRSHCLTLEDCACRIADDRDCDRENSLWCLVCVDLDTWCARSAIAFVCFLSNALLVWFSV